MPQENIVSPSGRQEQIQQELKALGLRMEPSLSGLDGEGHALIDLDTGEEADSDRLTEKVIELAQEWSLIEGVADQEAIDLPQNTRESSYGQ